MVIDLDDTLIRTDTLFTLLVKCLRQRPLYFFVLIKELLLCGRSALKNRLSAEFPIDTETLPYRSSIINLCTEHKSKSPLNKVILASAADQSIVNNVAIKLNFFDISLGSTRELNLKSAKKLEAIQKIIQNQPFTYVGDSSADIPIWKVSSRGILINPSTKVVQAVKSMGIPFEVIRDRPNLLTLVAKQMRLHQWVKNTLVCVPFIAAHKLNDFRLWVVALAAFFSFSLLASAVYVLNDLIDVESDRKHPSKCNRPFASGLLPIQVGFLLLPSLILGALLIAYFLPIKFVGIACLYFVLNLLYSFYWKEQIILDVILLGSFYTLRILAGGYATETQVSAWLLSFSTFFFFGLAMVKRYTEILKLRDGHKNPFGRGYCREDYLPVFVLGVGSSLLALLVLSLYFNSTDVAALYSHSKRMWLLVPLLLFWTSRLWLLAHRGNINDDPVVFAIRDRVSWLTGVMFTIVLVISL